jgi:hypothetical protein
MGDPKATEMPEAAAAESTSRFRAITELAEILKEDWGFGRFDTYLHCC